MLGTHNGRRANQHTGICGPGTLDGCVPRAGVSRWVQTTKASRTRASHGGPHGVSIDVPLASSEDALDGFIGAADMGSPPSKAAGGTMSAAAEGDWRSSNTAAAVRMQGNGPKVGCEGSGGDDVLFRDEFLNSNPILMEYMAQAALEGVQSEGAADNVSKRGEDEMEGMENDEIRFLDVQSVASQPPRLGELAGMTSLPVGGWSSASAAGSSARSTSTCS